MDYFVSDFLQDEYGRFHFVKISDFKTSGKNLLSEEWIMSSKLKAADHRKKLVRAERNVCHANILCAFTQTYNAKKNLFFTNKGKKAERKFHLNQMQ